MTDFQSRKDSPLTTSTTQQIKLRKRKVSGLSVPTTSSYSPDGCMKVQSSLADLDYGDGEAIVVCGISDTPDPIRKRKVRRDVIERLERKRFLLLNRNRINTNRSRERKLNELNCLKAQVKQLEWECNDLKNVVDDQRNELLAAVAILEQHQICPVSRCNGYNPIVYADSLVDEFGSIQSNSTLDSGGKYVIISKDASGVDITDECPVSSSKHRRILPAPSRGSSGVIKVFV